MPKYPMSEACLGEVRAAFEAWSHEFKRHPYKENTRKTKTRVVWQFVRWFEGSYEPGAELARRSRRGSPRR
jgi:hypothetical protein